MISVDVRAVSKTFGGEPAVNDVSFTVTRGDLVVLLGPSGCGKSTMLRMIAGLDAPTSGAVMIEGGDVRGLTGAARGVAMVFQSYALFPHLTVADNITFGLSVRGIAKAEQARRLDEITALLGLGPLLQRKPAQLSGGQQQRVALGRALIAQAPVCLLDEPLSNLDAQLRQELRREIRALQQRLGITMIYVTHDQTEAMSMADRVVLMKGGRIEQNGRPADLYQRPASLFAGRFIGSAPMNFLIAGTAGPALFAASGRGRVLGLRPEDVTVETAANRARFRSAVTAVEYLGGEALVTCVIAGRPIVARTRGDAALAVGTEVGLAWDEAAGHVFDANTGQRLALATFDAAASVQRHAIANQGVP
jgi:sn-glycerol 3-phosphate transport system ATP-binding protein